MSKLSSFAYGLFSGATIIPQFFNDKKDFTKEDYDCYKLGVGVSNLTISACGSYVFCNGLMTTVIKISSDSLYGSAGADIDQILKGLGIITYALVSSLCAVYKDSESIIEDQSSMDIHQIDAIGLIENIYL